MSLHTLSGSSQLAARAGAGHHHQAIRHARAQVEIEARSQVEERQSESNSFVDVVARQLSSGGAGAAAFEPVEVSRRSKAVPFGRRSTDDNYEGPIDLEQDEFAVQPSRVRRQLPSLLAPPPVVGQPSSPPPAPAQWRNGDIGTFQMLYPNGTSKNLMVGNIVYATQGSEDGSALNAVPLRAQIQTADGQGIQEGSLFALVDFIAAYEYRDPNDPNAEAKVVKPFVGFQTSGNPGVPFWMGPLKTRALIWSIDTTTGILTATYQNSILQIATNDNLDLYPNSIYTGNGDTDAWPAGATIADEHSPGVLRLVK